jgi:hypothetical protein
VLARIQTFRSYLILLCLSLSNVLIAINKVDISLCVVLVVFRGAYLALVYDTRRCSVDVPCFNAVSFLQTITKRCDMMQGTLYLRTSANDNAIVEV